MFRGVKIVKIVKITRPVRKSVEQTVAVSEPKKTKKNLRDEPEQNNSSKVSRVCIVNEPEIIDLDLSDFDDEPVINQSEDPIYIYNCENFVAQVFHPTFVYSEPTIRSEKVELDDEPDDLNEQEDEPKKIVECIDASDQKCGIFC